MISPIWEPPIQGEDLRQFYVNRRTFSGGPYASERLLAHRRNQPEDSESIASHLQGVIQEGLRQYAPEIRSRVDGSRITVEDDLLEVSPIIEHTGRKDEQFICAVRFEVSMASLPDLKLFHGAVGIGDSAADAEYTSVLEWFMAFGLPVIKASAQAKTTHRLHGYKVYPGLMAIPGG